MNYDIKDVLCWRCVIYKIRVNKTRGVGEKSKAFREAELACVSKGERWPGEKG